MKETYRGKVLAEYLLSKIPEKNRLFKGKHIPPMLNVLSHMIAKYHPEEKDELLRKFHGNSNRA